MPPKSEKSSEKVKKQEVPEAKSLLENAEALCQNEIARLESNFNAKMNKFTVEKEKLHAKMNDLIVAMNNLDEKMNNLPAEFQLAVKQIPREVVAQMTVGDALKLAKQIQEEEGASAIAQPQATITAELLKAAEILKKGMPK